MKELKELDYETDEVAEENLDPAVKSAENQAAAVIPAETRRAGYGRYALLACALLLPGLITGAILWRHNAARSESVKPAAGPQPADVVVASENQLRQVSVEGVSERVAEIDRDTTGKVGFNEDRLTPVFTPYAGRAVEVLANRGANVRRGEPLLVLESPDLITAHNDLASARSELAKAKIGLDTARAAAERAQRLKEREALAAKDLQQAEADLARAEDEHRRARAALAAVENRLALFGKDAEEIAELGSRPDRVDRRVVIRAPIAGTIVDRKVGPGQYVKPDAPDPLFLIADLSTLWVFADVYESDLASIRLNAPAEISVAAYPDRTFPAHISFLSPTVDAATRTVRVRCLVQNPAGLLKPDMFAKIKISLATRRAVPVVPASAVLAQGDNSIVLVEESPGRFRRREVQLGQQAEGYVVVNSGLRPGERVVTRGALLLNELVKPEG